MDEMKEDDDVEVDVKGVEGEKKTLNVNKNVGNKD